MKRLQRSRLFSRDEQTTLMESSVLSVSVVAITEALLSSLPLEATHVHFAELGFSRTENLVGCRRLSESLSSRLNLVVVVEPESRLARRDDVLLRLLHGL